jgi:hypothetical protein
MRKYLVVDTVYRKLLVLRFIFLLCFLVTIFISGCKSDNEDVDVKYRRSYKKHKHKGATHESKDNDDIVGRMYDKGRISYLSPGALKFESGNTMEVGLRGMTHLGDFVYFFENLTTSKGIDAIVSRDGDTVTQIGTIDDFYLVVNFNKKWSPDETIIDLSVIGSDGKKMLIGKLPIKDRKINNPMKFVKESSAYKLIQV